MDLISGRLFGAWLELEGAQRGHLVQGDLVV